MAHGGKRAGAGRKQTAESSKQKAFLVTLPAELVEWLDAQPESRAAWIANAIRAQQGKVTVVVANPSDDHPALRAKPAAATTTVDDHMFDDDPRISARQ